jgi:hypothetical protein
MQLKMPRLGRAPPLAVTDELLQVAAAAAEGLVEARSAALRKSLTALRKAGEQAKRAWSGSNLGYHATVYYAGLETPPPGAQFSPEWGLLDRWPTHQPDPGWIMMDYQGAFDELIRRAGNPDIASLNDQLAKLRSTFSGLKERAISLLSTRLARTKDPFLDRKLNQIEQLDVSESQAIERTLIETGAGWSRDSMAVTQGHRIAPHQTLAAIDLSATSTVNALDALEKVAREAALHLQRAESAGDAASTKTAPRAESRDAIANLFEQYDELVADVARSKHQFFRGNVKRWIDFLESTAPFARPILQQLEGQVDFKVWFEPYRVVAMAGGSKNIQWPAERAKRLGIQLLLFRQFATGNVDPGYFALTLLQSGKHINDGIADIVQQIFVPMSRELRRYLQELTSPSGAYAPASDRIVTLDHNSEAYIQTIQGLDSLVEALEQVNDYPDAEDKEQKLAELSAGRRLLRSARLRYAAIVAVLTPPLAWLGEKFAGGLVGQLAATVWQALKRLTDHL